MIKTIIVDDSRVAQEFLNHILSSDPGIQVVGVANTGYEAIEMVKELRPDVITMDIHMPGLDGYDTTRSIMETVPTPIVVVSASSGVNHSSNSFRLFEAGALAVVHRPPDMGDASYAEARKTLIQTVKLMSEIKVVKRFPNQSKDRIRVPQIVKSDPSASKNIRLIAIGASTGGPMVLKTILSNLPKDLPVPVMIVQHISKGFIKNFSEWLTGFSTIPIRIAQHNELMKPGIGYLAPDDFQMGISPGLRISLSINPPENRLCPSVDFLFRSVSESLGSDAIGVLLTGMGKDGAKELKRMRDTGAVTIAQDEASCVIFGMPGEAVRLGAAGQVLPPEKIAVTISALCKN